MKRIALVVVVSGTLLTLFGAFVVAKWPHFVSHPPPRVHAPVELPAATSTLTLPLSVDLDTLAERLNQELPTRLYTIDEDRDGCVPAQWIDVCILPKLFKKGCAQTLKTKITPAIDCHFSGTVDRGPLRLSGEGKTLNVEVPISASITARGRGDLGKNVQETARGAILASAAIALDIDEEWKPVVTVKPDFHWTDDAHVRILGIRITFDGKVEPKIHEAFEKVDAAIGVALARAQLRSRAEQLWPQGFAVLPLLDEPPVWLRVSPSDVGLSSIAIENGQLGVVAMMAGTTQTFVGPKPTAPVPTALPPLQKTLSDTGFHIVLPLFVDYAAAEKKLGTVLRLGERVKYSVAGVGNVEARIRKVTIYPTADRVVAVGLDIDAKLPHRWFGINGTVWLEGRLEADNDSKTIRVVDVDYGSATDNSAADTLIQIARLGPIRNAVEEALTYDFSGDYERGLAKANAALNAPLGTDTALEGTLQQASVHEFRATPHGIFLVVDVTGTAKVHALPK